MNFYFDYIYYRITQFYFKWDGRTGGTAIVAISMIQTLLVGDIFVFFSRLSFNRDDTAPYSKMIGYVFVLILVLLVIYNYHKYDGNYNRLKLYWKEETGKLRLVRGFLVIISLLLPWLPIILIGIYW